jgi:hypothetical protein
VIKSKFVGFIMFALTVILIMTNGNGSLLQNAFGDSESIVGDVITEDNINIHDSFEMKMRENHLSMLSEQAERMLQKDTLQFDRGIK